MRHPLLGAIEQLQAGNWDQAHQLAQDDPSQSGSWLHGILHWIEGDRSNAGYWYRRANRRLPEPMDVASELEQLTAHLQADASAS
jgi:hypothetical protein